MASAEPAITEPMMFAVPSVEATTRADGAIILRSRMPLLPAARCSGEWLE